MTQLRTYLQSSGIKQKVMADRLNISRGYMSELVSGEKFPGRNLAVAIERLTLGAVPVSSWSNGVVQSSSPSAAPENAGGV